MALTRDQLLKKAQRRYTEYEGVRLQSLTELEVSVLRGIWAKRYSGMDEQHPDVELLAKGPRELLAMTIVDENGERMFSSDQEDLELIGSMDPEFFRPLHEAARVHVGFDDKEVDRNEGKSEEATA